MTLAEFETLLGTLPRRYPRLMIDRLDACVPGESARALKNVTASESHFQGHFPDYPVMPGVLVLEALIQLSTLLAVTSGQPAPDVVRTLDAVRFKRQVIPGDRLALETRMLGEGRFEVRASVDGETAAEADVVLAVSAT
ncbi:MAG: 3-hydroxyacyl-ACP dehydratase FabZ [Burkholderiales bacterium]